MFGLCPTTRQLELAGNSPRTRSSFHLQQKPMPSYPYLAAGGCRFSGKLATRFCFPATLLTRQTCAFFETVVGSSCSILLHPCLIRLANQASCLLHHHAHSFSLRPSVRPLPHRRNRVGPPIIRRACKCIPPPRCCKPSNLPIDSQAPIFKVLWLFMFNPLPRDPNARFLTPAQPPTLSHQSDPRLQRKHHCIPQLNSLVDLQNKKTHHRF